jgi:hypothetical protein
MLPSCSTAIWTRTDITNRLFDVKVEFHRLFNPQSGSSTA